jgi:flagellar biosynthesis protein FlhF
MQVYTFRAGSLPEALAQVRRILGPEATVLPEPRWTDPAQAALARGWVEVRALPPGHDLPADQPSFSLLERAWRSDQAPGIASPPDSPGWGSPPPAAELEDYRRKLRSDLARAGNESSLVERLADAETAGKDAARWRPTLARRLADLGIRQATCQRWLDRWQQEWEWQAQRHPSGLACRGGWDDVPKAADVPTTVQAVLRDVIAGELPIAGPLELGATAPLVVVLAGPTGVGKTTTIAKLAARLGRQHACRVGLVAADHYRLAAIEQLRAYAQIMNIPLETAESPAAFAAARQKLSSCDLVLVDTAGLSPRDPERLAELATLRQAASPCELVLVLSATTHPQTLAATAEALKRLEATRLVLTKLDEAVACGPLLDWLTSCPLPLSYTTAGQNVPDDLEVAAAHPLASALLRRAWETADPAGENDDASTDPVVPSGDVGTGPAALAFRNP